MRVLVLHNRYRSEHPSGEDVVVDQEVALLREHGHEVRLYERRSDDIEHMSAVQKVSIPPGVVWSAADGRSVRRLLRSWPADVAHVHNTFPLMSASALKACSDSGVPVVATLHNFRLVCAAGTLMRNGHPCHDCLPGSAWPAVQHRCYRDSLGATLPLALSIQVHRHHGTWRRYVQKLITMSEFAREVMVSTGLPRDLIAVKPHFVPEPPVLRRGGGAYGMFLGRLSPEKGPDVLVDAWHRDMGPLLVVGDGPQRRALEQTARERDLDVTFLGSRPREEARALLGNARALVVSSRVYETFGLSAVEAMSAGVPVVAPNFGVLPEVVQENHNGLLFRQGDSQHLRQVLEKVLEPDATRRLGANARRDYLAKYTGARNHALLEQLYQDAVERRLSQVS